MNTIFRLTLLLSLLLHVSLFAPILWQESVLPPELAKQTIEFELLPQPEPEAAPEQEPSTEPEQPPPYKHTEDDISKTNTTDGTADSEPAKQPSPSQPPQPTQPQPEQPQQVAEQSAAELAPTEQATLAKANDAEAIAQQQTQQTQQSVQEFKPLPLFASQTQLQPMNDDALDDSLVENPLNSIETARARWFNQVLKEIENQVKQVWNKPAGINKQAWGEIRLELDPEGYLLGAWVHLPSGSPELDRSALQAIRSVVRYRIPQSNMSRYYRHLNFKYHGGEEEAS